MSNTTLIDVSQHTQSVANDFGPHQLKKLLAYRIYTRAVQVGELVRQPCESCGAIRNEDGSNIEGHHNCYDRPLDVRWLCEKHHVEWHRKHGKEYFRGRRKKQKLDGPPLPPDCAFSAEIPTGRQLRAARSLLGLEQAELAKLSGVARGTIRRMESFDGEIGARTGTLSLVQKVLEKAGVEFLNDGKPGVRLTKSTR